MLHADVFILWFESFVISGKLHEEIECLEDIPYKCKQNKKLRHAH
jgi:hypothetical protein